VRASLTLCMLLLRAISARAQVAFGRWILDDSFPQFRSHGRINVTGSGNLGLDGHALVPLCVEVEIAEQGMQFMSGKERDERSGCSACAVQKASSGAQLVSCSGGMNVRLFERGTAKRPEGGATMNNRFFVFFLKELQRK